VDRPGGRSGLSPALVRAIIPGVDAALREGYRLVEGPPTVDEYLALRERSGLSPKTRAQALAALPGSWAACHVVQETTGQTVGMGRVLGDGGWYFHVVDMAVLPEHQRQGLGDAVLTWLLERIRTAAPPGACVNLLADPPGRRLYARHGFAETAPHSIGMALRVDRGQCGT
jgi:GNAT superfamily N-acetyltransferase